MPTRIPPAMLALWLDRSPWDDDSPYFFLGVEGMGACLGMPAVFVIHSWFICVAVDICDAGMLRFSMHNSAHPVVVHTVILCSCRLLLVFSRFV
jgi:hypothetical protein